MFERSGVRAAGACAVILCALTTAVRPVRAQDTTRTDSASVRAPLTLRGITVIGTREDRDEARAALRRIPGSAVMVEPAALRATRLANLPDVLRMVPGVWAQPRFGAADESQISIRGSGLRNNFHLRGVNVLVNGMPYRNADGFTDFESLELLTADNIQVYKGANALRYGGGTLGGAINIETRTGYTADRLFAYGQGGSFGFAKLQAATGGTSGGVDWYASYAHTSLDGYRTWSGQGRDRVNLHAGWRLSPRMDLRTFALYANVREELPGSLTQAEMDADATQAAPGHVTDQWGRDYQLYHLGMQLRTQLGGRQRLDVAPYFQYRDITHPIFQVIRQFSRDAGVEARYERTEPFGGRDNRLTIGAQLAAGNVDNRRYVNSGGSAGALTKDQWETAGTAALYAEDVLTLGRRVSAVLGARWERATRAADDHFLSDGDQTDRREYSALQPKVGVLVDAGPGASQLYANVSRAYEAPLLLELNSLTVPGFIPVAPQDAWQAEIGTRGRTGRVHWDVSLFGMRIRDEITNVNLQPFPGAPFTVPAYRNIERARHYGLEVAVAGTLVRALAARGTTTDALDVDVSYTYARYEFERDSLHAGNAIPGAPRHVVAVELRYRHPAGLLLVPRLDLVPSPYFVDNANTVTNRRWTTVGLRAEWLFARPGVSVFLEGRNLGNARYSASVQVNDANGRFFEPADARAVYAGLRVQR